MKRLQLSAIMLAVAMSVAAVGSAALSSITFDRSVSAGQVLIDTDPNVAVQISNISSYTNLIKTGSDGKVSFNLNEAINNTSASGFNTDALYAIGTYSSGAIKIKNNSDVPVAITLTNDANNTGALTLHPSNDSSSTIGVGASRDFYFTLDTNNQDAVKSLSAVLHVEGSK